jgi:hypothetical protein
VRADGAALAQDLLHEPPQLGPGRLANDRRQLPLQRPRPLRVEMLREQIRQPLQVLAERLLQRLGQLLALVTRGRDQPVDFQRDRLDQCPGLAVTKHGRADLDRVA